MPVYLMLQRLGFFLWVFGLSKKKNNFEYLLGNWEGENITQGNICKTHCAVMSTSLSKSTFVCLH